MRYLTNIIILSIFTCVLSGELFAQYNNEMYSGTSENTDSNNVESRFVHFPTLTEPVAINYANVLNRYRIYGSLLSSYRIENAQSIRNHIYFEVGGYAWVSLNYHRVFPKYGISAGGGFGPNPYARNFTLSGDGGVMINLHVLKQFALSDKIQLGFGAGATHDFDGWYDAFWDPIFAKVTLNRYSISLANDRLYYGISLYYVKWENRNLRPSIKLGFSF